MESHRPVFCLLKSHNQYKGPGIDGVVKLFEHFGSFLGILPRSYGFLV